MDNISKDSPSTLSVHSNAFRPPHSEVCKIDTNNRASIFSQQSHNHLSENHQIDKQRGNSLAFQPLQQKQMDINRSIQLAKPSAYQSPLHCNLTERDDDKDLYFQLYLLADGKIVEVKKEDAPASPRQKLTKLIKPSEKKSKLNSKLGLGMNLSSYLKDKEASIESCKDTPYDDISENSQEMSQVKQLKEQTFDPLVIPFLYDANDLQNLTSEHNVEKGEVLISDVDYNIVDIPISVYEKGAEEIMLNKERAMPENMSNFADSKYKTKFYNMETIEENEGESCHSNSIQFKSVPSYGNLNGKSEYGMSPIGMIPGNYILDGLKTVNHKSCTYNDINNLRKFRYSIGDHHDLGSSENMAYILEKPKMTNTKPGIPQLSADKKFKMFDAESYSNNNKSFDSFPDMTNSCEIEIKNCSDIKTSLFSKKKGDHKQKKI